MLETNKFLKYFRLSAFPSIFIHIRYQTVSDYSFYKKQGDSSPFLHQKGNFKTEHGYDTCKLRAVFCSVWDVSKPEFPQFCANSLFICLFYGFSQNFCSFISVSPTEKFHAVCFRHAGWQDSLKLLYFLRRLPSFVRIVQVRKAAQKITFKYQTTPIHGFEFLSVHFKTSMS